MNDIDYSICETQGMIYEYAASQGYDFETFSSNYLGSEFCKKCMDTSYSRFQFADDLECWDFIYPEIKDRLILYGDNRCFDKDVAFWIGFTYRQLYIETGMASSEISSVLDLNTMCGYYPGLHTIDEEMAIDIIRGDLTKKGIDMRKNY